MAKRHWIAAVLVVSLGLNLLGAGALLARWSMGGAPTPMMWAFHTMDESTRNRMRPLLKDSGEAIAPLRREFRENLRDIKRIVTSDPLDEVSLAQALAALRDVSGRYQLEMHKAALEVLPGLSREQRVRVYRRLMQSGGDRHGRSGDRPPRPDHPRPEEGFAPESSLHPRH
ncbi:MAG: periplasmic heavy metal sensor [Luminiphilus sp.]|nr:periplasmic heavy metal sensor [Luminiphilus sp.]